MYVTRTANLYCRVLTVTLAAVVLPAPKLAAQSGGQPSVDALGAACADDAQRLCAGVQPGGGRVVACLKDHKDSLSDRCRQAAGLAANPGGSSVSGAAGAPPPSGANAPTAAAPAAPPKASPGNAALAKSAATTQAVPANAERFTERIVRDSEHQGMRVATIHIPEKWTFESKLE